MADYDDFNDHQQLELLVDPAGDHPGPDIHWKDKTQPTCEGADFHIETKPPRPAPMGGEGRVFGTNETIKIWPERLV